MPSTTRTGSKLVGFASDILKANGYCEDHSQPLRVRRHGQFFNVGEDFLKVFDNLAVGQVPTLGFYVGLIQVTDENHGTTRRDKIDARYPWPDLQPIAVIETWQWNPRQEWFVRYRRDCGGFGCVGPVEWTRIGTAARVRHVDALEVLQDGP